MNKVKLGFRLGLPDLGVEEVYVKILQQYGREVENVNKIYTKQKTDPPLNNNYPPIAGKITWARVLFKRINVPIWELQEKAKTLMDSAEGKKYIKFYNRLAKCLLEYEMLHYTAWVKQVSHSLTHSLLYQRSPLRHQGHPVQLVISKKIVEI